MNKKELVEHLAAKTKLTKVKTEEMLDAFTSVVSRAISKGAEVRIVDFGTFTVVHRKATEGRNPRTGAVITIAAKSKPKFRPGKALTEAVNRNKKKPA
jgi:DNA-binding protein HU-beta